MALRLNFQFGHIFDNFHSFHNPINKSLLNLKVSNWKSIDVVHGSRTHDCRVPGVDMLQFHAQNEHNMLASTGLIVSEIFNQLVESKRLKIY